MEQSTYYQNSEPFRHFISWRQIRISAIAVTTAVLISMQVVTASNHTSANQYRNHQLRHSGYGGYKNIDSLISNLKQSKKSVDDPPRLPLEDQGRCSSCSDDDLRREAIKAQILSKLGLKSKPRIRLPVPRDVVLETLSRAGGNLLSNKEEAKQARSEEEEELMDGEPDDFFGRTSEIITFAEPGHLLNGQPLLEFGHTKESDPGVLISQLRVKSALLWIRVSLNRSMPPTLRNLTLWVFKVHHPLVNASFLSGKDFDQHTKLVSSLSLSLLHVGWHKVDLTNTVREWYDEGTFRKEKLRLLVDCSGCREEVNVLTFQAKMRHGRSLDAQSDTQRLSGQEEALDPNRPFLVVHTEPVTMKRSRRRAIDCVPGMESGQCCKESFFVSFKELKWDDWIIAPKGYHANYCRGGCGGIHRTPDTFLNYYTHVIEEFRRMDRLAGIQPCCAPLKFSSMSLIYFGPDNHIIKRDLPKMVVDQCGCP